MSDHISSKFPFIYTVHTLFCSYNAQHTHFNNNNNVKDHTGTWYD